ncbi:hypothetical protein CRE_23989 [Caenorhabditis remanei]|uniref:Uncharacterized protein n=1 Tax=Caenorhabditis remanei TaxID=31234 RepID=E3MGC6_CAERE|nr:hypothetical protein CRE_23989 [Caenorhabditis remanei]
MITPNLSRLPRDTDRTQIGGGPSGYGPPPPEKDYYSRTTVPRMTSSGHTDDRLKNRYEACRSGMHELDVLRAKHTLLIQNLRSRLPVIPGSLDDVQAREKKSRDGFLDRFSLQSVDSGISSQNTISSTRSSTPEDFKTSNRHSNIYENSSTTMNYSTFRKMSLESTHCNVPHNNNNDNEYMEKTAFAPPVITSRSCHRGAWKTSPQRVRPKSMFDSTTSATEYLFSKPPRYPIDLTKERRSAFTVINQSSKRHSSIEPTNLPSSLSQLSLNDESKTPQKAEVIRWNKQVIRRRFLIDILIKLWIQKADAMFRANVVYVSTPEQPSKPPLRFSPARSPPVRRALQMELKPNQHYAQPCKIRSPRLNSKNVFAAKPIAVRPNVSPKVAQRSTWLQSQPL